MSCAKVAELVKWKLGGMVEDERNVLAKIFFFIYLGSGPLGTGASSIGHGDDNKIFSM